MINVPLDPEKKNGERPAERGTTTGEPASSKPAITEVPLDPKKK